MDIFTDVYKKCIDVVKAGPLDAAWAAVQGKVKDLLAPDGPDGTRHAVLGEIRRKLTAHGKTRAGAAAEILTASDVATAGFLDRAALIKLLRHLYFVQNRGGQKVWVMDGPRAYSRWPFELFAGKSAADLKTSLEHDVEVFGEENRAMMFQALQLAQKWAMDIQTKLSTPDAKTLAIVKRWFHAPTAAEADVKASAATLFDGFKKIAATCGSSNVIFSDRPAKRTSGTYDTTYASVNAGDTMPVIYIFKLFLRAGRKNRLGHIGKLWLCALTIIHELSHKKVSTDDIKYDDDGLKPGAGFTTTQALDNADSWGYFAADMVGALPARTFKSVYT